MCFGGLDNFLLQTVYIGVKNSIYIIQMAISELFTISGTGVCGRV